MIAGKVTDLSITGVGLMMDQPFAEGSHLMVRLPSLDARLDDVPDPRPQLPARSARGATSWAAASPGR